LDKVSSFSFSSSFPNFDHSLMTMELKPIRSRSMTVTCLRPLKSLRPR